MNFVIYEDGALGRPAVGRSGFARASSCFSNLAIIVQVLSDTHHDPSTSGNHRCVAFDESPPPTLPRHPRPNHPVESERVRFSSAFSLSRTLLRLRLHPRALHRLLGKHKQQFIVQPNRFVDLGAEFVTDLQILRRQPHASAFALQLRMQQIGKFLVLAGIADET